MKVFFYTPTLRPGGSEKQCALVASKIKECHGIDAEVVLNFGDGIKPQYRAYLESVGVTIVVLPRGFFARMVALYRVLAKNRDAVLFNYLTYPDFFGGLVAKIAGIKKIVGGIETDVLRGPKLMAEYVAHRFFATLTICNSFRAYEFFKTHGLDASRLIVMPSGIEPIGCVAPRERSAGERVKIITVGRFVWQKDYETWIKTIAKVHRSRNNISAVIIGYGELEQQIRSLIEVHGLSSVVTIIPGETADVYTELRQSDIYLSTSVREGTSNTILEAMNCALPIVATDVGDNAHMITNGINGYVLQPGDVDAISGVLSNLIDDVHIRNAMGQMSKKRILDEYALDIIVDKYAQLIKG